MKTIRIVLACSMLLQVALIASALTHGSSQVRTPREFEGCAPNPVPDSCMVPEQCLSCHPSMNRVGHK